MAFQLGQCCVDQVTASSGSTSSGSGKNEVVPFTLVSSLVIAWNGTRISRFGDAGVFYVELLNDDGTYRRTDVEAIPLPDISATTSYRFNFGVAVSGRVIIT